MDFAPQWHFLQKGEKRLCLSANALVPCSGILKETQTLFSKISTIIFLNRFAGPHDHLCCWNLYALNVLGSSLLTYAHTYAVLLWNVRFVSHYVLRFPTNKKRRTDILVCHQRKRISTPAASHGQPGPYPPLLSGPSSLRHHWSLKSSRHQLSLKDEHFSCEAKGQHIV